MSAAEAALQRQAELADKAKSSAIAKGAAVKEEGDGDKKKWTPVSDFVAWLRRKKIANERRMLLNEEQMKQDLERFLMEIEEQHTWVESELNYRNLERLKREEIVERAKRKEAERLAEEDRMLNMEQGLKFHVGNVESFRRWQNSSAKYQDIVGHEGPIYSVKVSPCLAYALSCSADCTARLWSLEEGKTRYPLLIYEGHTKKVIDGAIHPNFKMDQNVPHVITCGGDGTIQVYSTRAELPMKSIEAHTEAVYKVVFSRDGRRVASASEDLTVKSWCYPEMYCLYIYNGHKSAVTALDFSPTCRYIISGSDYGERKIMLWDSQMPRFEQPLQYPHMLFWSTEGVITKIIIRQFTPQETFWMTGDQMQYLGDDAVYDVWPGELEDVVVDDESDSDASSTDEVEVIDPLTIDDAPEITGLTLTAIYTDKTGKRTEPTEYIPGGMLTIVVNSQDVFLAEAFLDVLAVNTQYDMYARGSGQRLGNFIVNHPTPWEMETAIIDPLGYRKPRRPDNQVPKSLTEVDQGQAVIFRNSFRTQKKEAVEGIEVEEEEMEDVPAHPSKFEIVWFCPGPDLGPGRITLNFRFHKSSQWQQAKLTLRESPMRIRTGVDNQAEAVLQYDFDQEARHRNFFRFIQDRNWDAVEPFLDKKCVLFKEKQVKKRRWRCMDALEDIFDHHKGIVLPTPIIFKGGQTKSVVVMETCPLWHKREAEDDDDFEGDGEEGSGSDDGSGSEGEEEDDGGDGLGGGGDGDTDGDKLSEDARTDPETISISESQSQVDSIDARELSHGADDAEAEAADDASSLDRDSDKVISSRASHSHVSSESASLKGEAAGSSRENQYSAQRRDDIAGEGSPRSERLAESAEDSVKAGSASSSSSLAGSDDGGTDIFLAGSAHEEQGGEKDKEEKDGKADKNRPNDDDDDDDNNDRERVVRFATEVQVELIEPFHTADEIDTPSDTNPDQLQLTNSSSASASAASSHTKSAHAPMGLFNKDDDHVLEEEEGIVRPKAQHLSLPEFIFTDEVVGKHFQRDVLRLARKELKSVVKMKSTNVACAKELRLYSTDPAKQAELALIPHAPTWLHSSFLTHKQPRPTIHTPTHNGYYSLKSHAFLKKDIFGPDIQKFSFPLPANYPRQAGGARNAFRLQLSEYEKVRRRMETDAVTAVSSGDGDDGDGDDDAEVRVGVRVIVMTE